MISGMELFRAGTASSWLQLKLIFLAGIEDQKSCWQGRGGQARRRRGEYDYVLLGRKLEFKVREPAIRVLYLSNSKRRIKRFCVSGLFNAAH